MCPCDAGFPAKLAPVALKEELFLCRTVEFDIFSYEQIKQNKV